MMKFFKMFMLSFTCVAMLFSCGGGSEKQSQEYEKVNSIPLEAIVEESVPDSVSLTIEGNDAMRFNLEEMKVVEGQTVTVIFKHVGKMPKEIMGHNWVLLKPGTNLQEFGISAVSARENDYIPQDKLDQVIANTKTIGGGEETVITFVAPKIGYYKFICSFPGHYGVMQGTFVIEPK